MSLMRRPPGLEAQVCHQSPRLKHIIQLFIVRRCCTRRGYALSEHLLPYLCSRKGAFIGCSGYPECGYSRPLDAELGADGEGAASELYAAGAVVSVILPSSLDRAVRVCQRRLTKTRPRNPSETRCYGADYNRCR